MTVSSLTTKNSYSGDASTTTFAYGFKIFASSEIKVYIRSAAGTETLKTLTTHYTLTNIGNASGGNVVFESGSVPAATETVVLIRDTALTQSLDLVENDPFLSGSFEDSLDKVTHQMIEIQEEVDRSFKVSQTNTITSAEFTDSATDRASKTLGFDSSGNLTTIADFLPKGGDSAQFTYSTTTTDSDPGSGIVRFNNTTIGSATIMYVDDLDAAGTDVSAWLQSFDDVSGNATNRGRVRISKSNTLDVWHVFRVSAAVTNASGYTKITLVYIDGAGALADEDKVFISFVASGEDGAIPGYYYTFDTGTSDADPGAGEIAFNNATYASATVIYIDDADAHGVTTQADTETWGDSTETIKGYLHIVDINDETTYARFQITASVVDASGYNKITVVHLASNNTFSAADELSVHFTRNGDAGASPGYFYKFDTGTSAADPGAGEIAFNNATYASATAIYIDDVDQNAVNTVTDVLTWDDSTSTIKGYLHIVDINDHTTYARFSITGSSTDGSGFNTLVVTHIASNNTFSAADSLSVHFTRQGDKGDTGSTGAVGPAGAAGVSLTWETSTGDSDQGVGKMWGNNATFASISVLYIDDVDANSVNIEAWIQTLDDSTNSALRGTIYLEEAGTNSQFGVFSVTGACVDGTGYWKIPVSHVASNVGSLADGDSVGVVFSRTGNAGADGDGTFNNFVLTADSGTNQTVTTTNTVDIAGGNSITTVVGATDTVTINADDGTASAKGAVIVAGTTPASVSYSSGTATISVADSTASAKGIAIVAGTSPVSVGYSSGTATVALGTVPIAKGGTGATSLAAANIVATNAQNTFTKAQLPSVFTDASANGTLVFDFDTYQNFHITADGNVTLGAPTTEASQIGQTGLIYFIQDGTGSRTLSIHGDYETPAAGGITISTAANAVDLIPYAIIAENRVALGNPQLAFG